MSAQNYTELRGHLGHAVAVVAYGNANVAVECEECAEVLFDFDRDGQDRDAYGPDTTPLPALDT